MDAGFLGHFTGSTLSYLAAQSSSLEAGQRRTTVLADGFISNLRDLELECVRRCEEPALSLGGWIGLAYQWWGTNLSRFVLGQYSATVVDFTDRAAIFIQDSLGIRQVFYQLSPDGITFASHLIDLVRLMRPAELDFEYFADALANAIPATSRTPYVGITRVIHGATVVWRSGQIRVAHPWAPSKVEEPPRMSDSEYEAELLTRLSDAVDHALLGTKSVWCELSGGLDSTSVLAVALRNGHSIDAFSFLSSDEGDGGDTFAAKEAAQALGVRWHTLDAADTPPFSGIPEDFRAEPGTEIYDARRVAYSNLLREHGVSVVLTGVGGDATFGGPDIAPHHLADAVTNRQFLLLWRTLRSWERSHPARRSMLFWFTQYALRSAVKHFSRSYLTAPDSSGRLPSWLGTDFSHRFRIRSRARAQRIPRHRLPGRQALWQEAYGRAGALGVGRLAEPDIEFRHPLMDRRLMEFMLAIPFEQRQLPDRDRDLQRRALRNVLPASTLHRHTKGTSQSTFDRGLRISAPWIRMLTGEPRIASIGFVDRTAWLAEVQRARFGLYESLPHFVMAATIECWLRRFEEGLPAPISFT